MTPDRPFTVTFPDAELAAGQPEVLEGLRFLVADVRSAAWDDAAGQTDMLVLPYMVPASVLSRLAGSKVSIVQSQTVGYDGIAETLPPGVAFCNAAGVHESATAELALTLMLASLRGLPQAMEAQRQGEWMHFECPGLADKRVLVIGAGGVGREIARRLIPFEVELTRVARSRRTDEYGPIQAFTDLPDLLPYSDVVVLAVPLDQHTRGMVDAQFLARMQDKALLVNVSRGAVVRTGDLVSELRTGRLLAALDVTDPEPLPAGHPLWSSPGTLITPHTGGHTGAMRPRITRLLRRQIARLAQGQEPLNRVI